MTPEIRAAVKSIQQDRASGSRQLALAALDALRTIAGNHSGAELRDICRQLALARPMNAAIENAIAGAWSRYLDTGDCPLAVQEMVEEIEAAPEEIALAARKTIPSGTLMTHGYSSTAIELLTRLAPRKAIVTEARPSNEGLRIARELARGGISVTLITEAQMALMAHEADAVVVGADTVLPEGDLINRIGTRLLALAARDTDVPFYAVAGTLKVAAPSEPLPFAPHEGSPEEISAEKWLEVRNVYYDVTPARLVTSYVTERGVLDPSEVLQFSNEAERRWQALMNSNEL